MKRTAVLAACLLAAACGPRLAELKQYVSMSPRRIVAVAPFVSSRDNPDSGRIAAELLARELRGVGFEVIVDTRTAPGAPVQDALAAARAASSFGRTSPGRSSSAPPSAPRPSPAPKAWPAASPATCTNGSYSATNGIALEQR